MVGAPVAEQASHPQLLFLADLAGGSYCSGVDRGWWRSGAIAWPIAVIEVALPPRPSGEAWLALRFSLADYPEAPSAQPWDAAVDAPLPIGRWPGGGAHVTGAFRPDWRQDALYVPMDREALAAHPEWHQKYARQVWDPGKDITQYLRLVRSLLCGEGYTGARGG
jgi:hypothetical protein